MFTSEFKKIILDNDFPLDLVFNVDETGLYWKKLPSRTYISREEKSAPAFKASTDLICSLKGTPRVMKGILKYRLPVIWTSNRKAWVMQLIFSEWYSKHFCHSVLQFCYQNSLPQKAPLLLDNTPGYPPNLEDVKSELEVKIVFFSSPLTPPPCSNQRTKE